MNQTICDLCRRVKAQNEEFTSRNGVDACEYCHEKIGRFTKVSEELELEGE